MNRRVLILSVPSLVQGFMELTKTLPVNPNSTPARRFSDSLPSPKGLHIAVFAVQGFNALKNSKGNSLPKDTPVWG
jgi:hypothetical protein